MLKTFSFLSYLHFFVPLLFGYVEIRLDKKAKVNFNIYNVTDWTTNNCHTHIAQ